MKAKLKFAICLLPALLFSINLFAAPVDDAKAKKVAEGWLKHTGKSALNAKFNDQIGSLDTYRDVDGNIIYYVINLKPDGFIVVSSDDQIEPIISFSGTGTYDGNPENPLSVLLSKDMKARKQFVGKDLPNLARQASGQPEHLKSSANKIEVAKEKWELLTASPIKATGGGANTSYSGTGNVNDVRVDKLVQSQWSQGSVPSGNCYNYYTPNNYICGCVATAMAQLMRFHQFPVDGVGIKTFNITVDGSGRSASTRGGDGNGGAYNWGLMPLIPNSGAAVQERQMIGSLCYDAGVSANMQYSASSSWAYYSDMISGLKNVFGYSNCMYTYNSSGISNAMLYNMVNTNLDASLPVIFGILGNSGGHAIICDGYGYNSSTVYHHLNLGWAGSYDQWYNLPDIGTGYNYDTIDECVYNIFKAGDGEILSGRITTSAGVPISGVTVHLGALTGTTNSSGIYSFVHVTPGTYNITASKSGYDTVSTSKTISQSQSGGATGNIWGVDFLMNAGVATDFIFDPITGTITGYIGSGGAVTIPSTINGKPVINIGESAFQSCTSLTSVTIPDSVTSIRDAAFNGCTSLTSVMIGNSVTNISIESSYGSYYAFGNCAKLTAITVVPQNSFYSSIDGVLFNKNNTTLISCPMGKSGSYTIPDNVDSIGNSAFQYCAALTNITIGNSVASIGDGDFAYCTGLTTVTIPNSVTSIPDYAFQFCTGLTAITIPESVTNIGTCVVYNCTRLTSAVFLGNAPSMKNYAFLIPSSNFTVYYLEGALGFTSPTWMGYPSAFAYTLTYNAGANGSISGTSPQIVNHGASGTTVTAVPSTGCHFTGWSDGVASASRTDMNITANVNVTANFAHDTGDLTMATVGNGTTTPVIGTGTININTATSISATANTGYYFTNWTVSGSVSVANLASLSTTATLTGAHGCAGTVTANFAINQYTLTYTAGMGGTLTGTSPQTVNHGSSGTTVTAVASTAYHFTGWSDGVASASRTDTNITANVNVTANFAINQYTLTYTAGTGGTITGTSPQTVNQGSSGTTVTAASSTGYHFTGWSDGVETASRTDTNITANVNVTANFAITQYTLTYTVGTGGTITGTSPQTVNHGSSGTNVTAVANTGYHFTGWSDGVMTESRTDTNITANLTAAATFAINTYTVTFDLEDKGERTGGGDLIQIIDHGSAATEPTVVGIKGWTFNGWNNTFGNITSSQTVKALWIVGPPVINDPGSQKAMVGVPFTLPLAVESESSPVNSVTVTGLPAGLKFDAKRMTITGLPTAATNKTVTVTAKNAFKTPAVLNFTITVDPLSAWAYGSFNGSCIVDNDSGAATMTVTAMGKVTGKLSAGGVNYAFSSASYARRDEEGAFWISTDISVDKTDVPLIFAVRDSGSAEIPTLSIAEGWLANIAEGDPKVNMYRNVWKDKEVVLAETLKPYIGYYTAVLLPDAEYGSGYLTFTVDKDGGVKTAGKLADGTVVSLSSTLIIDGNEPDCGVYTVIYTSPAAYKGGCLFGLVEFVKPMNPVNPEDGDKLYLGLLKGIPFHWESRNIQATSEYGVGFLRVPGLSGGWYDNSINLSDYYEDKLTVAGIVASPLLSVAVRYTDFDPESEAENPPRKTTTVIEEVGDAGVSPNGIVLSLTFAKEIGIGLAAPKADTPKKDPGTGEYNYDLVNPTGLTLSFTRATGIFKGGFNVYYDYISAENSTLDVPTQTYSHVIKKALYEGVLTPVRNPTDSDNRGGRGFYLWPGKSTYEKVDKFGEPLVDKNGNPILIPYSFNWSYDFLINNGN